MLIGLGALAPIAQSAPLSVETKIALGDIQGRIDHLAVDLNRQRLYVADLGDTVGVIDLQQSKVINRLAGLKEPQGLHTSLSRIRCMLQMLETDQFVSIKERSSAADSPCFGR